MNREEQMEIRRKKECERKQLMRLNQIDEQKKVREAETKIKKVATSITDDNRRNVQCDQGHRCVVVPSQSTGSAVSEWQVVLSVLFPDRSAS
jgi:hypothetical protein